MPLPGFLCIGAQKAGTTWLFEQLRRHPRLWSPPIKELHYFDHLHTPRNRAWTAGHVRGAVHRALAGHLGKPRVDWSYVGYLAEMAAGELFTETWYRRCFDRPKALDRLCYDITPEYGSIDDEGIAHVLRLLPQVRILFIVRDPLDRALSQLRMNVGRLAARGSGGAAASDAATLLRMCEHPDIADRGNYRGHIPRWQAAVPAERLLILPYGLLRVDPAGFIRRIEDSLGVGRCDAYDLGAQVHASRKFEMPAAVIDRLAAACAPQYDYLARAFGQPFVADIR